MVSTAAAKPVKVFVSYRHHDGDWVWNRLVPCLKAGGAEVLIDRERFRPGGGVYRQMDTTQDQADKHVLVLSDAYIQSDPCKHEMNRAIDLDPAFEKYIVLPVRRDDCAIPIRLKPALFTDLRNDALPEPWTRLLAECGANLGTTAPHWLDARDEVMRWLKDDTSVNLHVLGDAVKWQALIEDVRSRPGCEFNLVDLHNPRTEPRPGLVREMLAACAIHFPVRESPYDLTDFADALATQKMTRLGVSHFDLVTERTKNYTTNLFTTLKYQVMDAKNLVLLLQSRQPLGKLFPASHPLSNLDIKTVELKARP